ncbi:MAG TPA: amino acid ABC transporter substrate-binding protein [Pseudomonadales bacterium]|jgi:ABC-type amino acid transport substrate-binding protein
MSLFRIALRVIVLLALPVWAVAGTLDEIAASGEFRLAYRADTPPFSSRGKGGEPEGFTIDLCRIIARDVQAALNLDEMKITWVPVTAENRFDAIVSGRAHLECGSSTVTLSRQERVDFSNLTYVTGASLMRWADSDIDRVGDLDGRRVSAIAGTTTEKVLKETLERDGIDAKVVVVGDHAEALQLLLDRKIDAMAGDQATLFGIGFKTQGDDDLVITEDLLSFEPYALPLRRNDADFRLAVNRSLSELYVRGDVGRSWEKWFGSHGVRPTRLLLMLYRLNSFSE